MRHTILFCILFLAGVFIITSCKREIAPEGTASLTIINAVAGSNTLVTNFKGSNELVWFYSANELNYNYYQPDFNQISSYSGPQHLSIYQWPDTLVNSKPLLQAPLDLPVGSINSLFLTGTVEAPDFLFTTDTPLYHPITDSVTSFRFVNLSPGSAPVSINIQGSSYGSEVNSLPYKSITEFKNYAATQDVSSITFECRDKTSGTLIASFTANNVNNDLSQPGNPVNEWRYRNHTLALLGVPNGSGTTVQTLLLISNY